MLKISIIGFIFGSIILPFLVVLGSGIPYLEYLKPLSNLGLLASQPLIVQVDADTSYVPAIGWIIFGITNGIFYSLIFAAVHFIYRKLSASESKYNNYPDPRA